MLFFLNVEGNLPSAGGQFRIFSSLLDALLRVSTLEFSAHVARPERYAHIMYEYFLTFLPRTSGGCQRKALHCMEVETPVQWMFPLSHHQVLLDVGPEQRSERDF